MPILQTTEPGYWDRFPAHLEGLKALGVTEGVGLSLHVLGAPSDETAPAALVFRMPPNFTLPRHAHVCQRFEIVVEGSIQVGDRTLHPGDIMTAEPNEAYGPHVAGPDGCTTLEIFSTLRGAYVILFDTGDGLQPIDFSDPTLVAALRCAPPAP